MSDDQNDDIQPEPETPDAPEITPAQTENPVQAGLQLPDNVVNLVPFLLEQGAAPGGEKIKKYLEETLPEQISADFEEGMKGREGWMEKRRVRMKLWLGAIDEKKEPFKNCANMHDPIMLSRCLRLSARTFAEIFKQGQPILTAQPNSRLTEERAQTVTKHMNMQLRKECPSFPRHVQRGLHEFFRDGDTVFYSYRDTERNVNVHEHLSPEEFVYPYAIKSVEPDMSDLPWKVVIRHYRKRDLQRMAKSGFISKEQVEKVIKDKGTYEDGVDHPVRDEANAHEGVDRKDFTRDVPYTCLEYHGWSCLPGQDEDIPVRVLMAQEKQIVLGMYQRYYDDPVDKPRFDQQSQEHQQFHQALMTYSQLIKREDDVLQRIQQPDVPPEEAQAIAQQVQQQRPMPPIKPQWMSEQGDEPKPCRQKVIEPFSHAVCIENPDGSFGLGIGSLIEPHNMAANIMLNQAIDQGTIANGGLTFIHSLCKLPPGVTSIEPGKLNVIDGIPLDTMAKGIFQLNLPQPNPMLLQGVNMQHEAADAVSSAPDVLSGEKEGDETFRGQATRVEQAVKQLTVLAGNFMLAMTQIAKNTALLNFQFLPDAQDLDVPNPITDKPEAITVGRDLYKDDLDLTFSADLTFTSRAAKIAEKDDLLGMVTKGIPPQLASMIFGPQLAVIVGAIVRDCLVARGAGDIAALMPSAQQIQQAQSAAQQQAQMRPPGAPGAPPPGGPAPHPSVPTGQPTNTPGAQPQRTQIPPSVAREAAPAPVH